MHNFYFSQNDDSQNTAAFTKDGITDKILNGSKIIFDQILSPSKEKLSFPKVHLNNWQSLLMSLISYISIKYYY